MCTVVRVHCLFHAGHRRMFILHTLQSSSLNLCNAYNYCYSLNTQQCYLLLSVMQSDFENRGCTSISNGPYLNKKADEGLAYLWSRWQALKHCVRVMYPTRSAAQSLSEDPAMVSKLQRQGRRILIFRQTGRSSHELQPPWLTLPGHWLKSTRKYNSHVPDAQQSPSSWMP